METIKDSEEIYTDFQGQQVAIENPNSFWSKFFLGRVVGKIKKKPKVYTFAEKRKLVEKRNLKKNSLTKRK